MAGGSAKYTVYVAVLEAKDVPKHADGETTLIAAVYVDEQVNASSPVPYTPTPSFGSAWQWTVSDPQASLVRFVIWEHTSIDDEMIGDVSYSAASFSGAVPSEYWLELGPEGIHMRVAISVAPEGELTLGGGTLQALQSGGGGKKFLYLDVIEATFIPKNKAESSAFVAVYVGQDGRMTRPVVYKDEARWAQAFQWIGKAGEDQILSLRIFEHGSDGDDECVAEVAYSAAAFPSGAPEEFWLEAGKARIHVAVSLNQGDSDPELWSGKYPAPDTEADEEVEPPPPEEPMVETEVVVQRNIDGVHKVYFAVLEGEGLAKKQEGPTSVFVVAYLGDQGKVSGAVPSGDRAEWSQAFEWDVRSLVGQVLRVQAWEHCDTGTDVMLGDVAFAAGDFPVQTPGEYWIDLPPDGGRLRVAMAVAPEGTEVDLPLGLPTVWAPPPPKQSAEPLPSLVAEPPAPMEPDVTVQEAPPPKKRILIPADARKRHRSLARLPAPTRRHPGTGGVFYIITRDDFKQFMHDNPEQPAPAEVVEKINRVAATEEVPAEPGRLVQQLRRDRVWALVRGNYQEARAKDHLVKQIRTRVVVDIAQRRKRDRVEDCREKLRNAQDEVVAVEGRRERRIEEFERDARDRIAALAERHGKDLEAFEAKWNADETLRRYSKPSPELIRLCHAEKCARVGQAFDRVVALQAVAQQLETEEALEARSRAVGDMKRERAQLESRHSAEHQILEERLSEQMRCLLGSLQTDRDRAQAAVDKCELLLREAEGNRARAPADHAEGAMPPPSARTTLVGGAMRQATATPLFKLQGLGSVSRSMRKSDKKRENAVLQKVAAIARASVASKAGSRDGAGSAMRSSASPRHRK